MQIAILVIAVNARETIVIAAGLNLESSVCLYGFCENQKLQDFQTRVCRFVLNGFQLQTGETNRKCFDDDSKATLKLNSKRPQKLQTRSGS